MAAKRLPLKMDIRNEINALMKAEHKNVVSYYDFERDHQWQYLVTERCQYDLNHVILDGDIKDDFARHLCF